MHNSPISGYIRDQLVPAMSRISISAQDLIRDVPLLRYLLMSAAIGLLINYGLNPFLSTVLRSPLRKHFGLQFGEIKVTVINLTFKLTNIELLSSESRIIRAVILAVFPSAHVKKLKGYPDSKVTVKCLSVKLRVNSVASFFSTCNSTSHMGKHHIETEFEKKNNICWIYHFIPKPHIKVKLHGLDIQIEKAYLAPKPPDFCSSSSAPSPVQNFDVSHLPTFEQDSMVDWITNAEIVDADNITYFIERWIDHVKTKLPYAGRSADPQDRGQKENVDGAQSTYDEKINAILNSLALVVFHSFTLQVFNASIILSGVSSNHAKTARKKFGPRRSNFEFTMLPQNKRALTVGSVDLLSFHFSPNTECIGVLCFVGASLKVGLPAVDQIVEEPELESAVSKFDATKNDTKYNWHTVAHPFDIVTEVGGIIPIIIWAISYDHHWNTRVIDFKLSASEIVTSLSSSHVQTAFFHLDDYTDMNSPSNEWVQWLTSNFQGTLTTDENEKQAYCEAYSATQGETELRAGTRKQVLIDTRMDLEKRMSRYEIICLRCMTMEKNWRIPKDDTNDELATFLERSRSSITKRNDIKMITFDEPSSPFERQYPVALRALIALIREKYSFVASAVSLHFHCGVFYTDFPSDDSLDHPIPSCLNSRGINVSLDLNNVIFGHQQVSPDADRSWFKLEIQMQEVKWDVLLSDPELPAQLDNSPIGILYKYHQQHHVDKAVSLSLNISSEPTKQMDPHYCISSNLSNMSFVVNPLPLLSVIQTLILLSDLPFQAPSTGSETLGATPEKILAKNHAASSEVGIHSLVIPRITLQVNVECCSLIFIIDRKKLRRGVLDLDISKVTIDLKTSPSLVNAEFSSEPFELCAGQYQQHDMEGSWVLMPLKPIMLIEGTGIVVSAKEKEKTNSGTLEVSCYIVVDNFDLNAGPSTICSLSETVESLRPFVQLLVVSRAEDELRTQQEQREMEEEHLLIEQKRELLKKIFESVDHDGSGTLQYEELDEVIRQMLENEATCTSQQLTELELKVQRSYLLSILDPTASQDISFDQFDDYLFRVANSIDDVNLIPKYAGRSYQGADNFLSNYLLRSLVHYDDIREYASWHEVHRIIGDDSMGERLPFPLPNFWFEGGIDRFFEVYKLETGCTKFSLNGQDIHVVQKKLVRALCNYEFAKFCWRSLVQPLLQVESNSSTEVTSWVLESNENTKMRKINLEERILKTISSQSMASVKAKNRKEEKLHGLKFDISFDASLNHVSLGFGSTHTFTSPLLVIDLNDIQTTTASFLSYKGGIGIVPMTDGSETRNKISFRSNFSVMHLNTRHGYLEFLIEPYPCFGNISCIVTAEGTDYKENDSPNTSFSAWLECSRSLNINLSPSAVEAAIYLKRILMESDPKSFRKWIINRDIMLMRSVWDEFQTDDSPSDALSQNDAKDALRQAADFYWRDEFGGLPIEFREKFISDVVNRTEEDEQGMIPFHSMRQALVNISSRCYFSGCKNLHVINNSGRLLNITTQQRDEQSVEAENGDDSKSIRDNCSGSVILKLSDEECAPSGRQKLDASMSIFISGYRELCIEISPYQPFMLGLKLPKNSKRRRRRIRNASGFAPNLVVVPQSGSLTSISLLIRTSLTVKLDCPVKIVRIVQLPKSFGRPQGSKKTMDLSKMKHLSAALKTLVEGANIVFEKKNVQEGDLVPVHLDLLDSLYPHALLIQDVEQDGWRHPVLLTKSFLFNPTNIQQVIRCQAMSGVVVRRERLHIRQGNKVESVNAKSTHETAWDCTLHIVPYFKLQNSLPFDVSIRLWQLAQDDDDDLLWQEPSLYLRADSIIDDDLSDDDSSAMTPTSQRKTEYLNRVHQSPGIKNRDFLFTGSIEKCQVLCLSGISLRHPIFMQFSQRVISSDFSDSELLNILWSNPVLLGIHNLRTGSAQKKGTFSLPKVTIDLGDDVDALVDVSVDRLTRMPSVSLYCPYWIINKAGMKLEYKVNGQNKTYYDGGVGGMPVMIHGAKSIVSNAAYKKISHQIKVIPLESPSSKVAKYWWDKSTNGKLVLNNTLMSNDMGWSDTIELDASGTSGELRCKNIVLQSSIDSLAGAFHRSSLVTISPRYIVKNTLHMPITVMPFSGSLQDVMKKAIQLRIHLNSYDKQRGVTLKPGESTICYHFHNISPENVDISSRWIAFCVNAVRSDRGNLRNKWHIIPTDRMDLFHYGEHDGLDTMCGILQVKVHQSGIHRSILITINHSSLPPYRIENRSASHSIQFVQDDDDATVFTLPPMHSCGYTWDSPFGKKELVAVILMESEGEDSKELREKKLVHTTKLKRFFTEGHQKYDMLKPGRQKNLPKKLIKEWKDLQIGQLSSHHLHAHLRIMGGTKILSFSDSDFLAREVERGNLRKGGGFKHAGSELNFEGLSLYVIDDYNRELLGITAKDIQVVKHKGTIESIFRVRHFQIDAMLPTARYPIIIQPLPLGVDRREPPSGKADNGSISVVAKKDCFWQRHSEKPIPILELSLSYVPQTNMVWIPDITLMIAPCKIQVDVDYILRVTAVFINSVSKIQDDSKKLAGSSSASDKLQYVSRDRQLALNTYIEKLHISPIYFKIELNIKPDDSDEDESYERLTLSAIAQSTNSAFVAGVLSWLMNVGSNFAHVSPCFRYKEVTDMDRYCDVVELITDIAISYVVHTIKQCYKVVFSMHLLGDPSLYAYQVKTGVTDLFVKTHNEIITGGQDGVGQGVASFFSNVIGGVFEWGGKVSGGLAETIDSVVTSEYTSNHLRPKSDSKQAQNVVEGVVQGTEYLTKTVVHGMAGLIGDPYRGMKSGGIAGAVKGTVSGVSGAFFSPFVGALGFVAATSEGLGVNAKILNLAVIESRCRPARSLPWGSPIVQNELSFLKGVGIRVHTVRYQKVRKQMIVQEGQDLEMSPKDIKRIRAAEERRKYPPYKVISIVHNKQRQHYLTYRAKPKLLPDLPGKVPMSYYAVTFEETIIVRTTDLQLDDQVKVNFWNHKGIKAATTRSRPLATCILNISDIFSSMVGFYKEQLAQKEKRLVGAVSPVPEKHEPPNNIHVPIIQEFCLFRPCKSNFVGDDILEAAREEILSIQQKEQDAFDSYDSDFDSDDSMFGRKKPKKDEPSDEIRLNERLYGTISLSFFPIPW